MLNLSYAKREAIIMSTTNVENMKLNKPRIFAFFAVLGLGISFILFLGNSQMNGLKANPLPLVNKQAQAQCFEDLLAEGYDISGANGSVCRGR